MSKFDKVNFEFLKINVYFYYKISLKNAFKEIN